MAKHTMQLNKVFRDEENRCRIDLSKKSFLIIDDMLVARSAIRSIASQAGATNIRLCSSYADAVKKMREEKAPDVVLCDYHLGDTRDGQQLFEEMRHIGLVTEATIWIMCTSESSYSKVMAVAELIPDDYILKPFTAETLRERLIRIVEKKDFFGNFYRYKHTGRHKEAFSELARLSSCCPAYLISEVFRKQIETLIDASEHAMAERMIGNSEDQTYPWMRAYMAKCAIAQGRFDDAINILEEISKNHPNFLSAADMKAQAHEMAGNLLEAQKTLSNVVKINPMNWRRQKRLSLIAHKNGDTETAKAAIHNFMQHVVMQSAIKAEDHLLAAEIHLASGDTRSMADAIRQIPSDITPENLSYVVDLIARVDREKALAVVKRTRSYLFSKKEMGREEGLQLIMSALTLGDESTAETAAERLLMTDSTRACFSEIKDIFNLHGAGELLPHIQKRVAEEIVEQRKGFA